MLYNKKGQRCRVLSTFMIGDRHYSRIKLIANGKEEVTLTADLSDERVVVEHKGFVVGENEKPNNIEKTEEVIETPVDGVGELEEVVKTDRLIEATDAKKRVKKVKESDLEPFCLARKLDYQAVLSCLRGEQKTHRKWGFAYLD